MFVVRGGLDRNLLRYLHKIGMESSVGETFTANTNTLKHTVTGQLIQHKRGIDETRLFLLVGNDATDEVRVGLKCVTIMRIRLVDSYTL